jgi:hypothetical protein
MTNLLRPPPLWFCFIAPLVVALPLVWLWWKSKKWTTEQCLWLAFSVMAVAVLVQAARIWWMNHATVTKPETVLLQMPQSKFQWQSMIAYWLAQRAPCLLHHPHDPFHQVAVPRLSLEPTIPPISPSHAKGVNDSSRNIAASTLQPLRVLPFGLRLILFMPYGNNEAATTTAKKASLSEKQKSSRVSRGRHRESHGRADSLQ